MSDLQFQMRQCSREGQEGSCVLGVGVSNKEKVGNCREADGSVCALEAAVFHPEEGLAHAVRPVSQLSVPGQGG